MSTAWYLIDENGDGHWDVDDKGLFTEITIAYWTFLPKPPEIHYSTGHCLPHKKYS